MSVARARRPAVALQLAQSLQFAPFACRFCSFGAGAARSFISEYPHLGTWDPSLIEPDPAKAACEAYELTYRTARLKIHVGAMQAGDRCFDVVTLCEFEGDRDWTSLRAM